MSFLKKLFGGGRSAPEDARPVAHEGFAITPRPAPEGGKWRIGALIEKDGQSHHMIRADLLESREAAAEASLRKARQMIDEQGKRLFDGWD
ncbi:MAG: HlyU family transcriptional regulator [Hasllibacter sp.]